MLLGLSFREILHGTYWLLNAPTKEQRIDLDFVARANDVRGLARDRTFSLGGLLDAVGLASQARLEGTLAFKLFDERRLPYCFRFRGDDGCEYELSGQTEWLPISPVSSIATLPASLYDGAGREIGRAALRFDMRAEGLRCLRSVRLHLSA